MDKKQSGHKMDKNGQMFTKVCKKFQLWTKMGITGHIKAKVGPEWAKTGQNWAEVGRKWARSGQKWTKK